MREPERIQTVVIGAGQAGLSVGYFLAQRKLPFVILDANKRVGDSWRRRWDSLRLFSVARFDGLAGMPFPGNRHAFPTKDQMADYLESYAKHFKLPVRTSASVDRVSKTKNGFLIEVGEHRIEAEHVVIAMANYQKPLIPSFAGELAPDIVQVHSSAYRNPTQLGDGPVLIVGAGNSGAEIAMELTRSGREIWMSGRDTGHVPFRIAGFAGRRIFMPLLFRVVFHRILTEKTPMGRKAKAQHRTAPLIRVKPKDLLAAGVKRVSRTAGVRDGRPLLEDGRVLDVSSVVWSTGFHSGFSWLDVPAFDETGEPKHARGVAADHPGLYFVGLHFLYSMSSAMVQGVGRDAEYVTTAVADAIAKSGGVRRGVSRDHPQTKARYAAQA